VTWGTDDGGSVARPATAARPVPSWALTRRILVVEDSPSARRLLQGLLLRLGVTLPNLRLAATPAEALRVFTAWQPEIAFVDLQLRGAAPAEPGNGSAGDAEALKNGADLAVELLRRSPGLKVIICSASEPESAALAPLLRSGQVHSMVKPVLAAKVAEMLALVSRPTTVAPRSR
jgi:CheY-like chemotaxis protein